MKKIFAIVLAALMMLSAVSAFAEAAETPAPKLGQVVTYVHGNGFAVVTAVVQGDTIILAKIDEFQFLGDREDLAAVGVPVKDGTFSQTNAETGAVTVLGSKRVNSDLYSLNMQRAGSTVQIAANYNYIEAFVVGKTIEQLEKAVEIENFADAVSGATLADTPNYVKAIIAAAKAAGDQTGTYTIYNKTGETVTELYLTDNVTGEKSVNYAANGMAADAMNVITTTLAAGEDGSHRLTLSFKTEGGYEGEFATLSIEVAPITLLAADAMTGATQISFFAPAE